MDNTFKPVDMEKFKLLKMQTGAKSYEELSDYEKMKWDATPSSLHKNYSDDGVVRILHEGQEITSLEAYQRTISNCEYIINKDSNQKIWFSQLGEIFFNENGEIFYSMIIYKDGTSYPLHGISHEHFEHLITGRKFRVSVTPMRIIDIKCERCHEKQATKIVEEIIKAYQIGCKEQVKGLFKNAYRYILNEI